MTAQIVIAAGGTVETALLPYYLVHLLAHYDIEIGVALSNGACHFVTPTALQALTQKPVYQEQELFYPADLRPFHIVYSEADLLIIYPASARIVAECSSGSVTCPVTRLFAFAPKERIIVAPSIHPRMDPEIYSSHVTRLEELGTLILKADSGRSLWPHIESAIATRLHLESRISPDQMWEAGRSARVGTKD